MLMNLRYLCDQDVSGNALICGLVGRPISNINMSFYSLLLIFMLWLYPAHAFSNNSPPIHHLHRHRHQSPKHGRSTLFPVEVCADRRYWKPLPHPEAVIGYGYNLMTGRMTTLLLFNMSIYDDKECRLSSRRSPPGLWDKYRLPSYVLNYTFYDESMDHNLKLRFRYIVYNSTPSALLDAKRSRSLPIDVQENIKYEDLNVNLKSAPLRYFTGARSFSQAMEDLALSTRDKAEKTDSAASVLYSLRASATTGEFQLKPKDQLHWRHLDERFRRRLRQAIVDDDFLESFFDEVGTHYATGGTFGGVSERWWISRPRPEKKCSYGEESKILDADLMAACDRFRLGGSDDDEDNTRGKDNTSVSSAVQSLASRCHLVFDDERFRTSRWTVTSGAPADRLRAAHTQQAAFSGRSDDVNLRQWLSSLNVEPSTVRVNLAPICDLLALVDERSWHLERCREQLLDYVKIKDPFYAGKDSKVCKSSELPLKFQKLLQVNSNKGPRRGVVETRDHVNTNATMSQVHCLSTLAHPPERTCRSANDAPNMAENFWSQYVLLLICLWKAVQTFEMMEQA